MLQYLIYRPIAVLMTTLSIVMVSLVFVRNLPISLLPEIPVPKLLVQVSVPNSDARTLENTVVRPIRNQLLQVSNVKDIKSRTRNGAATIEVIAEYGTNIDLTQIEINEKIDQAMYLLPRDIKRPKVVKTTLSDIPIYEIAVTPKDSSGMSMYALSSFCEKEIVRRLEQLDEVAMVDMHGFTEPQITIIPDQNMLKALGRSEGDLLSQIAHQNAELGNIVLKEGAYEFHVKLASSLTTLDDISSIPVRLGTQTYLLHQLAQIKTDQRPKRGSYLYNDKDAIVLSVRKQSDANNFKLKKEVDTLLNVFNADYTHLEFHIIKDQSKILKASFDNLFSSLFYGLLFSSLLLLWFIGNWRTSLIVLLVVPVSLIISLLFFYLLKVSINMISITGLILGVGLMIDNAIITIENIRIWQKSTPLSEAVVKGPNEILAPMLSSALTTISVFMPLILFGGIAGALFYDQALSIAISLSCSVIVSFMLIPVLYYTMMQKGEGKSIAERKNKWLYFLHHHVLTFALKNKFIVFIMYTVVGFGAMASVQRLSIQSFPKTTTEALEIKIDWYTQIDVRENEKRMADLYRHIYKEIINCGSTIGELQYLFSAEEQNRNESSMTVNILPNQEAPLTQKIHSFFKNRYPDAQVNIKPVKNIFDYILNTDELPFFLQISERGKLELPSVDAIEGVIQSLSRHEILAAAPPRQTYFSLKVDRIKTAVYQVSDEAVIRTLKSLFGNLYVTELKSSEQYIPIYLHAQNEKVSKDIIQNALVRNESNQTVMLQDFITWETEENYKTITADRVGESVTIPIPNFNVHTPTLIQNLRKEHKHLEIRTGGNYLENEKMIQELQFIFWIVVGLLYLILAAQFESFILPLIVMISVPLSVGGALITLYLTGESINLISLVGLIIMSGIVVNDSILKVDMINKGLKNGLAIETAIIQAGEKRVSAILMTSLTTILALLPLFFSEGLGVEIQKPMAIAIISGISLGTVLSLTFTPILYNAFEKIKAFIIK